MKIQLVDVTVHIDETLDESRRGELVEKVRARAGVVGVGYRDEKPHLMTIEYNPDETNSTELLNFIKGQGVHGELIGL